MCLSTATTRRRGRFRSSSRSRASMSTSRNRLRCSCKTTGEWRTACVSTWACATIRIRISATTISTPACSAIPVTQASRISSARNGGNDRNNLQPRVGATWDKRGDGSLVLRGGFGMYNTRNRPWFQVQSMNAIVGNTVVIFDTQLLQNFPDINAVLAGKSLDQFVAAGGAKSLFIVGDESVLPYALNSTVGAGWQINPRTSLDVDYVHDVGNHQLGGTDRNLPPSGPISANNPRPVSAFTTVNIMENFTKSWYDALETQFRTRFRAVDNMLITARKRVRN